MIRRKKAEAPNLPERLESLSDALDMAKERLDPEAIEFGHHVLEKASARLKHGTTHTLVALLGATGAGKSSVSNQIVGSDVATTGVRRPTTSSTMAMTWGPDDSHQLLDWLGVESRHAVTGEPTDLDGLILLDVPDHDSVALDHRLEMERIAEHTDLMVWVTDPEKYADASMHHYLRLLSSHDAVTVMVLNKADRLTESELAACRSDLARLLMVDGLQNSRIVTTSATTGHGIEDLIHVLEGAVRDKDAAIERLSADVSVAVADLSSSMSTGTNATISDSEAKRLADDLVQSSGLDEVAKAVANGHRRDAAAATGWPVTRWAGRLRSHPIKRLHLGEASSGRSDLPGIGGANQKRALGAIRQLADTATKDLDEPWPSLVRSAGTPETSVLSDQIDSAISATVRDRKNRSPRWWSVVRFVQNLLAIVMVAGLIWLLAIFAVAWFQLPPLPTPEYRGFPVPTLAAIGGALAGVLLAALSRLLARLGAKRRARRVRTDASAAVRTVAEELVVVPMRAELDRRNELGGLLAKAAGQ